MHNPIYSDDLARMVRQHKQHMHDQVVLSPEGLVRPARPWNTIPVGDAYPASVETYFGALAPAHWSLQA